MAATLTIEIDLSDKTIAQAAKEVSAKVKDAFRNAGDGLNSGLETAREKLRAIETQLNKLGPALQSAGVTLTAAITVPLGALAALATKAAVENDKYEKTLTAVTGSAEKARAKIAELRDVAAKSPGVLAASAVATYAQLKAIGDIAEGTTTKVIKAVGKLSSVFDVGNANEFTRNLTQIFQQGFERSDIKEAIGRVPIFEQLLERAFGTKDADKLRQLKEAGKITLDSFFAGMAEATNNDPRLRNIQESIGSQFEKLKDRVLTALIPLGETIIRALSPVVTALVPVIEKLAAAFAGLPQPVQTLLVILGGVAAAIGPVLVGFGLLASSITSLIPAIQLIGNSALWASFVGGISAATSASLAFIATPVGLALTALAAVLAIGAIAWLNYESATDKALKAVNTTIPELTATNQALQQSLQALGGTATSVQQEIAQAFSGKTISAQELQDAISQLDPAEQAYIRTLATQEEQVNRTRLALEEKRKVTADLLAAERQTAVEGFIQSARAAEEQANKVKALNAEYGAVTKALETMNQQVVVSVDEFGRATTNVDSHRAALGLVGERLTSAKAESDKMSEATRNLAKGLIAAFGSMDQAKAGLDALARSHVIAAQDAAFGKDALAKFAVETSNAGNAAASAAGQVFNLAEAISKAGLAGARADITGRIEKAVVAAKGNITAAVNALKSQNIDAETKKLRELEKATKAVNVALGVEDAPKAAARRSATGGSRAESEALREAKAERTAIVELAKQRQAEETALARQAASEREAQLQHEFNFQRISYEQFYADKLQLQREAIQRELDANALAIQQANKEVVEASSNAKTKLSEVIRLATQLGKLRNEQKLLEGKRDTLAPNNEREQEAANKRLTQSLDQLRLRFAEVSGAKQQAFDLSLTLQFEKALEEAANAPEFLKQKFLELIPQIKQALILQNQFDTRTRESGLRSEIQQAKLSAAEAEIQGLRNQGILTETQATDQLIFLRRQQRESLLAELDVRRQIIVESAAAFPQRQLEYQKELAAIDAQIAGVRNLGTELTRTEQIQLQMAKQGVLDYQELQNGVLEFLASQKGLTQIFQDFQTNQMKGLFDVLDAGLDRMTKGLGKTGSAVRELIKDLVRLAATKFFERLFGVQRAASPVVASNQGAGGGIVSTLLNSLVGNRATAGGVNVGSVGGLGGGTFGGSILNFAGGGNAGSSSTNLLTQLLGIGGTGATGSGAGRLPVFTGVSQLASLVGLQSVPSSIIPGQTAGALQSTGVFGSLLTKLGIKKSGTAGAAGAGSGVLGGLALAAPFLGLSLGVGVGGQSTAGKIVGGLGGLLAAGGIAGSLLGFTGTAGALIGAGASTGFAASAAAFFSNPITAVIGGALLVGSYFLGKAKQRKADEKLVDTYWVEYMNRLKELTSQVNADRLQGDTALEQAAQSRAEAVGLISQIKTKSVRESRLANQIPDVDRLFLEPLKDAVERQRKRQGRVNQLIPEFATGGIVPGIDRGHDSVLAMLRPKEVVLNQVQQTRIKEIAGADVFAQARVPGFGLPDSSKTINSLPAFETGGRVNVIERFAATVGREDRLVLDINYSLTTKESGDIVEAGFSTERGRGIAVRTRRRNRLNREDS